MSPRLLRHAWLLVLVAGVALFLLVERTMVATHNPNFVPSAILLGAAVVPLTFVTFVRGRRLPFLVSGGSLAVAGLLGGVLGTIVAGTLEFDVQQALGVLPALGVAIIEESAKLVVPVAVLLALLARRRRPGVADGLLLGVACGAGFAALETMGYAFVTLLSTRGSIVSTIDVLMLRGLMSPAGHMAWTGITAAALFAVAASRPRGRALTRFGAAFVLAVALHATWDGIGGVLTYLVLALASLGALTFIAHRVAHAARAENAEPDLDRRGAPTVPAPSSDPTARHQEERILAAARDAADATAPRTESPTGPGGRS